MDELYRWRWNRSRPSYPGRWKWLRAELAQPKRYRPLWWDLPTRAYPVVGRAGWLTPGQAWRAKSIQSARGTSVRRCCGVQPG
ncbi:MAG TPA: hypothetical protein VFX61_09030 [Micromonosporaceae bacterium]|nr:hypothetical protein [Micromonosporaceae bacterium]